MAYLYLKRRRLPTVLETRSQWVIGRVILWGDLQKGHWGHGLNKDSVSHIINTVLLLPPGDIVLYDISGDKLDIGWSQAQPRWQDVHKNDDDNDNGVSPSLPLVEAVYDALC